MPARNKRDSSPKKEALAAYRTRFRRWTMEALPDMPADEWERLIAWVNAFGFEPGTPHGHNDIRRFTHEITGAVTGVARRRKGRTPLIVFKSEKEQT